MIHVLVGLSCLRMFVFYSLYTRVKFLSIYFYYYFNGDNFVSRFIKFLWNIMFDQQTKFKQIIIIYVFLLFFFKG